MSDDFIEQVFIGFLLLVTVPFWLPSILAYRLFMLVMP